MALNAKLKIVALNAETENKDGSASQVMALNAKTENEDGSDR